MLQSILNSLDGYHVAESGIGSPGRESLLYGKATSRAVVKFQKAHGIPPTGNFGFLTREALNKIKCESISSAAVPPIAPSIQTTYTPPQISLPPIKPAPTAGVIVATTTQPKANVAPKPLSIDDIDPDMRKVIQDNSELMSKMGTPIADFGNLEKKLIFGGASPRAAAPGSQVIAYGNGFIAPATIEISGHSLPLDILSGAKASFTIPSDLKPGLYDAIVKTNNGTSESSRIAVIQPGSSAPTITNVDPAAGNNGSMFTITGANFADTNDIDTSGGTMTNVSSDGKTIHFTLAIDPSLLLNGKAPSGLTFGVSVRNKYGASEFTGIKTN